MKLLHVDSSILGQGSISRDLSADVVAAFRGRYPGLAVTRLDLAVTPIGHLTAAHIAAVAMGRVALEEFLAANIVVIGEPMYNPRKALRSTRHCSPTDGDAIDPGLELRRHAEYARTDADV